MKLPLSFSLSVVLFIIAVSAQSMPSFPTDFTANYELKTGLGGNRWWNQKAGKMYFSSTQGAFRFDQQQPETITELSLTHNNNNTQTDYIFYPGYCGVSPNVPLFPPIPVGCNAPQFSGKDNTSGVPTKVWFIDGCPGAISLLLYWVDQPQSYPIEIATFFNGPWNSFNDFIVRWQITNFQSGYIDPSTFAVPAWCPDSSSTKKLTPAELMELSHPRKQKIIQ